jgi:hypothetical protein
VKKNREGKPVWHDGRLAEGEAKLLRFLETAGREVTRGEVGHFCFPCPGLTFTKKVIARLKRKGVVATEERYCSSSRGNVSVYIRLVTAEREKGKP